MLRLSEVLMRMMAKSPGDRFEMPDDLRDELTRVHAEATSGHSRFVRKK
jgi:hypothetical protein